MTVSWTKNDVEMDKDILEEFATGVAEARARGRKPENFVHSNHPNLPEVNCITSLDRWIDFLNSSVPGHPVNDTVPKNSEQASLADNAKDAAAARDDGSEDPQDAFSMSKGGMKRALDDIDNDMGHFNKKLRVTREQMEDLDLDQEEDPERERYRRFMKYWREALDNFTVTSKKGVGLTSSEDESDGGEAGESKKGEEKSPEDGGEAVPTSD